MPQSLDEAHPGSSHSQGGWAVYLPDVAPPSKASLDYQFSKHNVLSIKSDATTAPGSALVPSPKLQVPVAHPATAATGLLPASHLRGGQTAWPEMEDDQGMLQTAATGRGNPPGSQTLTANPLLLYGLMCHHFDHY